MKTIFGAVALLFAVTGAAPLCGTIEAQAMACCKKCTKGKACGDTCIARDRTCTKGPGCACNA